jgi:AcrR family transcriptional regulator
MTTGVLAPQQQRSRDTLARLLKATLETLDAHGLDGATIPRIAEVAGVAPASVYRRFRDRDALFRAALLDGLEASVEATAKSLRLESFKDKTLTGVVTRLVALQLQQYRARPGLLRALTRFIEQDTDSTFRAKALALTRQNLNRVVEVLLEFRDEIRHRDPRRSITFAILTMATVVEVRALESVSLWHEALPLSDAALQGELVRTILGYLRSAGDAKPRKRSRY